MIRLVNILTSNHLSSLELRHGLVNPQLVNILRITHNDRNILAAGLRK